MTTPEKSLEPPTLEVVRQWAGERLEEFLRAGEEQSEEEFINSILEICEDEYTKLVPAPESLEEQGRCAECGEDEAFPTHGPCPMGHPRGQCPEGMFNYHVFVPASSPEEPRCPFCIWDGPKHLINLHIRSHEGSPFA